MTTRKRTRGEDNDCCDDFADAWVEGKFQYSVDPHPKKNQKRIKKDAKASPSNTSSVHDGASPPTVDSKLSSNPQALVPIRRLSFSNGAPESSIVMKRLKDLCSMKEPTVNVGIEIVGAAYLLKLMTTKRPSRDDGHDDDDDKIGPAMKQAVEATKLLFQADHLRNNALQLLSESQKLFMTNF